MGGGVVTLFLCGDVMLGRGVDQILAHPGDPALREAYVRDARSYVRLAESAHGPVPVPVDPSWPWGAALRVLDEAAPDARILNLETSVTGGGTFAPDKEIHYRMHPANLPALAVARPDVTVLANNHVLDFGSPGLLDTLDALARAGLRTAGAGRDADEAYAPAAVPLPGGRLLRVSALGARSSGIPSGWAATADQPGVACLPHLSSGAAATVVRRLGQAGGDLSVVSVHWGSNWGYRVPREQVRFAHALIDGGVDVVHGHSSHHPRPLEVYRDRLILYGCGDFVDDYEGISGYEEYRDDLRLAFLVSVEAGTGRLAGLRMVPFRVRRMRLEPASREDGAWLRAALDRISGGVGVRQESDGSLVVPAPAA
ncbi:CapA family protein [Streptomyces tuirus]|uniref:Putative polyglutamine synthesis accessory protein n=1 Tax=Streptomyces tuirus TaxID=68278 RepID=A0A7G1NAG7_9ACTN|nr:CapA family protein [Streptomyces tuirus]BCL18766.1 putative polyglutamine synthesis accessory protein [Streptomyces tuirus]